MRSTFATLTIAWAILSAPGVAADTAFGDPLSGAQSVRIGDLVADPETYVDQRVTIVGLVDDVCPMKGCWVDILDAQSTDTIRFKVEDDVIVFPVQAKGDEIVAEGILRKHELSKERAEAWLRHLADEKGETFDSSTVTGPMAFYQIEGSGAVIQGEG